MIPTYLATRGSGNPTRNTLQSLTALIATGLPPAPHHTPGHQRILALLAGGDLTVSETAAYLYLPVSVCKVLATQLIDDGHLRTRVPLPNALAPNAGADQPTTDLLKRVMSGLHALKD